MTFVRSMAQAAVSGSLPIKASTADTTPDNLLAKLAAGAGVSLALLNPGANEQVEVSAAGADENVQASPADTTPGPLSAKLAAAANVTLTLLNPGAAVVVSVACRP